MKQFLFAVAVIWVTWHWPLPLWAIVLLTAFLYAPVFMKGLRKGLRGESVDRTTEIARRKLLGSGSKGGAARR